MPSKLITATKKLYLLVFLQALLVALMIFVPFGLDQPSPWGLHYGHLVAILAIYVVALLIGLIESVVERKWIYVLLQIAPVVLAMLASLVRPLV